MSQTEITRCRPFAMRRDYLVRGVARRAIWVVLLNGPKVLTEFEEYWLALHAAKVAGRKGWKSITLNVSSWGAVNCWNAAHTGAEQLGQVEAICESDHGLNDNSYYSPPGLWIKPALTLAA